MINWRYFLRVNGRAFIWWLVVMLIGGFVAYQRYCQRNYGAAICRVRDFGPTEAGIVLVIVGAALVIVKILIARLRPRNPGSFTDDPHLYHRQIIILEGKVVKVLSDGAFEKFKRKAIDKYRTFMEDPNSQGRYIHQRFLMSSRILRSGHVVLVEHNTNYGKLPLKKGDFVRVRGEYLHPDNRSRFRYGKIHFTHAPKGEILVQW